MKQASVPSAPQTVNTSLIRECLELILILGDAMDRKKAERPNSFAELPPCNATCRARSAVWFGRGNGCLIGPIVAEI